MSLRGPWRRALRGVPLDPLLLAGPRIGGPDASGVPYGCLLRPRFAVFAAIPVDLWLWEGSTRWVVLLSLPFLLVAGIRGAQRLRSRL